MQTGMIGRLLSIASLKEPEWKSSKEKSGPKDLVPSGKITKEFVLSLFISLSISLNVSICFLKSYLSMKNPPSALLTFPTYGIFLTSFFAMIDNGLSLVKMSAIGSKVEM